MGTCEPSPRGAKSQIRNSMILNRSRSKEWDEKKQTTHNDDKIIEEVESEEEDKKEENVPALNQKEGVQPA